MGEKLSNRQYRKVERILYDYNSYETAIENIKAEISAISISFGTSIVEFSPDKPHAPNSQQERLFIKQEKLKSLLNRKQTHKRAVEKAVENLRPEERKLVEITYFEKTPKYRICQLLRIPGSTYYKRKNQIVYEIAKFLGLVE